MSNILRRKTDMSSSRQLSSSRLSLDEESYEMHSSECEPPKKKRFRAKLDHLSHEQKLERRKEKNRIAAQTARDRKRLTMEQLRMENLRKEAENRRKDQEIAMLKAQIKMLTENRTMPQVNKKPEIFDSGVSEASVTSQITTVSEGSGMDIMPIPQKNSSNLPRPTSPDGSSTSGAYSSSPLPNTYIDSMVGEAIDEEACIDEILKLERSVYSESGNESVVGSAASICGLLPRARGTPCQSLLVENSAGWTSIQLMLLLLITKVHRLYSAKIDCCAKTHNRSYFNHDNLYDYIFQSNCSDYRRAAGGIISNKDNTRIQRLIAVEFVHMYLFNNPLFRQLRSNFSNIPTG